ncbi:hypothetical protein [Jeongeupia chitinilytica]|uniref:hypothetical protein n=1 Tax=Jeongeupia chitinilytica TaxID=1041641 RepID=UPI00167AF742|nr:hypothetical protein [Jeongeupia chitinilytica]
MVFLLVSEPPPNGPVDLLSMYLGFLFFAYPLGVLPAGAAATAHLCLYKRFTRMPVVILVCAAGVVGYAALGLLLGNSIRDFSTISHVFGFLLPPIGSAFFISMHLYTRQKAGLLRQME